MRLRPSARPAPPPHRKVVILGGGPNRIGQGIEFDYCCCHACFALTKAGYETIMVNCNPETVSTDYDTSDRLYFEPLTLEHVLEILRVEQENGTLHGVIVQFGGQTPLKLANALARRRHPDPRHHPRRHRPRRGPRALPGRSSTASACASPTNGIARSPAEADGGRRADRLPGGHPPLLRPRRPRHGDRPRRRPARPLHRATPSQVSGDTPVLLDSYLSNAIEVDVDAICRRHATSTSPASWSTSRRPASTPATAPARSRPTRSTPVTIAELKRQTESMALALGVVGLMNIQFAIQDGDIYVLEVNPRASPHRPLRRQGHRQRHRRHRRPRHGRRAARRTSRSAPPTPQGAGPDDPLPFADPMTLADPDMPWFSVKEAVMPFNRFPGVDTLLGPEMRSTGEVMGWDRTFPRAFLKAQLGAGTALPTSGTLFVSVKDGDKTERPPRSRPHPARPRLPHPRHRRHRRLPRPPTASPPPASTRSTRAARTSSTPSRTAASRSSSTPPKAPSRSPTAAPSASLTLSGRIPYYTTAAGARAAALAMRDRLEGDLRVRSLQG